MVTTASQAFLAINSRSGTCLQRQAMARASRGSASPKANRHRKQRRKHRLRLKLRAQRSQVRPALKNGPCPCAACCPIWVFSGHHICQAHVP